MEEAGSRAKVTAETTLTEDQRVEVLFATIEQKFDELKKTYDRTMMSKDWDTPRGPQAAVDNEEVSPSVNENVVPQPTARIISPTKIEDITPFLDAKELEAIFKALDRTPTACQVIARLREKDVLLEIRAKDPSKVDLEDEAWRAIKLEKYLRVGYPGPHAG